MFKTCAYVLSALVFFTGLTQIHANTTPGLNAEHFKVLCRLMSAASAEVPKLNDSEGVTRIQDEVDAINVSLAERKWFDEVKDAQEPTKLSEAFRAANPDYEKKWPRWKAAVRRVSEQSEVERLEGSGPAIKLARARLAKVEGQMQKLIDDIKKTATEPKLGELSAKFQSAIGDAPTDSSGNRDAFCGASGLSTRPTTVGKNLANDLFCLCAKDSQGTQFATGKECAPGIAANHWSANQAITATHAPTIWSAIQKACGLPISGKVAGSIELGAALEGFDEALRIGGKLGTDSYKPGLLGSTNGHSSPDCKGDHSSNSGICVFYGTEKEWTEIPWRKTLTEALNILKDAERANQTIQASIGQLKTLHHRAQEIYEEVRASLEIEPAEKGREPQTQAQSQNPITSTDKATAQEAATVSITTTQHFILPWTLLI